MCEETTQPAPERLVQAPEGHEWREVDVNGGPQRSGEYYEAAENDTPRATFHLGNGQMRRFVAAPVPVWPADPGEYRMRRADGHVVMALRSADDYWMWLDGDGRHRGDVGDVVRGEALLSPVPAGAVS